MDLPISRCSKCGAGIPKDFPAAPGDDPFCPGCFASERGFCMHCGEGGGSIVRHKGVLGYVFAGQLGSRTVFLCPRCARKIVMKSLVYTSIHGWWGVIPFVMSLRAQSVNLKSLWTASDFPKAAFPLLWLAAFWLPVLAVAAAAIAMASWLPGDRDEEDAEGAAAIAAEAKAELAAGRFESAAAKFYQAVEARPGYAAYRFELGFALLKSGRPADAEIEIRKGLELGPGGAPREVMLLAEIAAASGRHAEAASLYGRAIDESCDPAFREGLSGPLLRNFLCQAHRGYQDSRRESAPEGLAEEYGRLAAANPGSALHVYLRARVEDDQALAERLYAESAGLAPDFFEPAYAHAYLLFHEGWLDRAVEEARALVGRWPGRPQALILLAEILAARGEHDAALAAYAELGKSESFEARAAAGRGSVVAMKGGFAEAEGILRSALAGLSKGDYWRDFANLWLGLSLRCRGEDASGPLAEAAASRTGAVAARAALWLGESLLASGRDPAEAWKRGATRDPGSFEGIALRLLSSGAPPEEFDAALSRDAFPGRGAEALFWKSVGVLACGDAARAAGLRSAAAAEAGERSVIRAVASGP